MINRAAAGELPCRLSDPMFELDTAASNVSGSWRGRGVREPPTQREAKPRDAACSASCRGEQFPGGPP